VHPDLGTLADLDELIAQAGQRDMRVLLDLVPNHTSSAHPWFVEAASGRDAPHRGYYVWADPAPDGGPPNNWIAATGQPAWTLDDGSGQYYLNNFLPSQPDLNWWDPAVHEEFREILRFWFDRGVAGFRIDVAQGLYKDAQLRDDPPAPPGELVSNRFGLQQVYSANRPESHGVFRDWRKIADSYLVPRLLLGETWVGDLSSLAAFHGHGDELQLTFNFPFIFTPFTAEGLAAVVAETLAQMPAGECPVWTASNHDISRFPTRWCGGDEHQVRLALLVLATLPGTLVLYYGDEIGMTDVTVPAAVVQDKMRAGAGGQYSRDRSRTPMPWDGTPMAGFTAAGVTPWLPIGEHARRNVATERADPASTLNLCRGLLAMRRAELGGRLASYTQLPSPPGLWIYQTGGLTVLANFTGSPVRMAEPVAELGEVLISTARAGEAAEAGVLGPWAGIVARTEAED